MNYTDSHTTKYYEKYICELYKRVVKHDASKLIYDNVREKYVVCFKFNENYYDLSDDDKYYLQCYLERNYTDLLKKS